MKLINVMKVDYSKLKGITTLYESTVDLVDNNPANLLLPYFDLAMEIEKEDENFVGFIVDAYGWVQVYNWDKYEVLIENYLTIENISR